jgi:hypothetical protein
MTPGYYSSDPDVDSLVAGMVGYFGINPWARVPHEEKTVKAIIEACRYLLDDCDACVETIHITVH